MQQLALRVLPWHCSQHLLGSRDLSYLNMLPYQHAWLCLVIESFFVDSTQGRSSCGCLSTVSTRACVCMPPLAACPGLCLVLGALQSCALHMRMEAAPLSPIP